MPQLQPRTTPTGKQKMFVQKYVENGFNGVKAAQDSYNADYDSAKVIASRNLDKPAVIQELDQLLTSLNLSTDSWIADKLKQSIESGIGIKATNKDAITALNMLLKVNNSYPSSKRVTMHIGLKGELSDKNVSETIELLQGMTKKTDELIEDIS